MVKIECPWCEEELSLPPVAEQDEQSCPCCLTTWRLVGEQPELTLAA